MWAMIPMLRTLARSVVICTATSVVYLSILSCVKGVNAGVRIGPRITSGSGRKPCWLRPSCACPRGASPTHRDRWRRPGSRSSGARTWSSRGGRGSTSSASAARAWWTDPAALHLDARLHVVQRTLQRDDRVGTGLRPGALERAVDDALRDLLLAVDQDLGDQLGDERRTVDRV